MSQENVEMARRAYEAFNRGDLDGMVADFAPEFEYVPAEMVPGFGGEPTGPEGMEAVHGDVLGRVRRRVRRGS